MYRTEKQQMMKAMSQKNFPHHSELILHFILFTEFILPTTSCKITLFGNLTCVSVRISISCFASLPFITQSWLTELICLITEIVPFLFICLFSHLHQINYFQVTGGVFLIILFVFLFLIYTLYQNDKKHTCWEEFWRSFLDYFPPNVSKTQQKRCHCI